MKNIKLLLSLVLIIFPFLSITAQNPSDSSPNINQTDTIYYVVQLMSGREYFGYILADDGREIKLNTESVGIIFVKKQDVKFIKPVDYEKSKVSVYKPQGSGAVFNTRYFFTNNALPVKKGENYAMIHLYGPEAHFAINDKLNLGFMTTWIGSPAIFVGKYTFYSKELHHMSFGSMTGTSSYLLNGRGFGGLSWGTYTYGNEESNFSISIGQGIVNQGIFKDRFQRDFNPDEPYYVPYEITNEDIFTALGFKNNAFYSPQILNSLTLFGMAGIIPVSNKVKFIFDSMFIISRYNLDYVPKSLDITYEDYSSSTTQTLTQNITIMEANLDINNFKYLSTTVLFMPSMRFEQTSDKVLQVSLGGLINYGLEGQVTSSPLPMISWLRQF